MDYSYKRLARCLALTTLALTMFSAGLLAQPGSWTEKQPLGNQGPNPETRLSFSVQDNGYILVAGTDGTESQLWQFDPLLEKWIRKADFPGGNRIGAFATGIGARGYVGFGMGLPGNTFMNDWWEYDPVLDNWTRKADLPAPGRYGAAGFSINNKGYVGTGDTQLGVIGDFWEYDPALDKWTQKADAPGGSRFSGKGMSIGNKGYLGLGLNTPGFNNAKNDFWQYTPETNSWIQKADFAGEGRIGTAAFSVKNKGYIGGGFGNQQGSFYHTDFWEYDPDLNTWMQKTNIPGVERSDFVAFTLNNTGYVGSGSIGFNVAYTSEELYKYDPASDRWTPSARLGKTGRWGAVAFSIGSKGYITTGSESPYGNSFGQNELWEFDPSVDKWIEKAPFPGGPRINAISFTTGNKAYVGMGFDAADLSRKSDLWCYDPSSNSWERKADLPALPRESAVAFSIGDKGYVGTGFYSDNLGTTQRLRDFWEYDPVTDKWTRKADMPGNGRSDAIGFSVYGKAYAGLGNVPGAGGLEGANDLWEYDPLQNTWLQKADFPGGKRFSAVAFSIDSNGYVALGRTPEGIKDQNDIWQYNPSANVWTRKTDFPGEARHEASAFSIGNKAYVGTGIFFPFIPDLWEFDPDNTSPVANAWLMKYYSSNSVLLNAWGSHDPDGGPIRYSWQKITGPDNYTIWYGNAATPQISNMQDGKYTFRLTVTDKNGATAASDVTFEVKSNQPPIANGWLMKYYTPTSVLMNAWGSYDPEGGPVAFSWTQIGGPSTATISYANASTPVISDMIHGRYTFELTVTDNGGATGKDTVEVVINIPTNITRRTDPDELNAGLIVSSLKVFPNPVKDMLNLRWTSSYYGKAKLTVMDMSGGAVLINELQKGVPELTRTLPVSSLKSGIYYLHIVTGNGKPITTKFLKE